MPNKEFLETYPLYKEFKTTWNTHVSITLIEKPAIHLHCDVCDSCQTFNMVNQYTEVDFQLANEFVGDRIVRAKYQCSCCKRFVRQFYIKFFQGENTSTNGEEYACVSYMKVGQFPSWSIEMNQELEKMLGVHADNYKKGLVCESQSYGIGAYAYFRRITENIIGELLDSIPDLIDDQTEKDAYKKALEEVKKTKVAEKKIELVKDLLPDALKATGINPLKALYGALSVGLHDKTDEECMELAEIIRDSLVYLVN
ncbi:MAG: hypothetical protein AAB969_01835, partial [Patescibacteria group bacterium]